MSEDRLKGQCSASVRSKCVSAMGVAANARPEDRLAALSLVKEGRVFELDQLIHSGSPHFDKIQPPFLMSMWSRAESVIRSLRHKGVKNAPGVNLESVHMTFHVGTHIDALGHFTAADEMFGGYRVDEVVGDLGLKALGAETIPPLITRGVCIDVAAIDGETFLKGGRAIGCAELKQAIAEQSLEIRPGDTVLIRTGWGRFYSTDNRKYTASEPGIDLEAAKWLTGLGVYAIGADTMAVEVLPGVNPTVVMPVHQHALVEKGVYLIENLALDELTQAKFKEFCFVLLSTRFRGATGSPARPIALV